MSDQLSTSLAAAALILAIMMAAAWALAMATRNGGWADSVWTFAVGAAGAAGALLPLQPDVSNRQLLAAALALLWSLRLGGYLVGRTAGKPEDARYADLRATWGAAHPRRLFLFLEAQALAGLPLAGAMILAAHRPGPSLDAQDLIGAVVLTAGVGLGGLADRQLASFKADPANRGKVCDVGLWSLSRHPNYFFEWLAWCAWPIIALDLSGAYWSGALALAAPALIYYLLVHVSGVPPLEAHMERSRGEAFRAYKARTPVFFPELRRPRRRSIVQNGDRL